MPIGSLYAVASGAIKRTMLDLSGAAPRDPFAARRADIARLRSYHANEVYRGDAWRAYRQQFRLPRSVDGFFNPTMRAVEFYQRLFDGAWTEDGRPLPDGTAHMVQFPQDLIAERPELVAAAIQFLDWSDWQSAAGRYVAEGGMVGTAVLELAEQLPDPETGTAGRCWLDVVPLERVAEVVLDSRGFLLSYALEYRTDEGSPDRPYLYRKTVDKFAIRTYRDDRLDAFGDPDGPERENPYGFVPAWWVKHKDLGGLWGAPVIDGVIPKIDRINALASGAYQFVNKYARQPLFFEAESDPSLVDFGVSADDEDPADRLMWLRGPVGSKVSWLMQPMPLGDARTLMQDLIEEIHRDLPEVLADERLRGMSQITAPGARAAMGDVRSRFRRAQRQYFRGLEYAIKAGVAVAGWRLSRGDWPTPTRQQAKFAGFDLASYAAGDLDLAIERPDLFPESELERLQAAEVRRRVYDLSAAHLRRADGIVSGTEAEVAKQNAKIEAELTAELARSGDALAAL
jgi:hypothetical protein